jgi:hypothetical protein
MELLLFVAWMLGSLFEGVIGLVATERFSRFLLWGGVALGFSLTGAGVSGKKGNRLALQRPVQAGGGVTCRSRRREEGESSR